MSNYERFKPTPLSIAKKRAEEVSQITNQYDNENDQERIKKKTISDDGSYVIRMWPAHPGEDASATEPKVVYILPGYKNKRDSDGKWVKDSEGNYIKELGLRSVFNAKVHGGADFDLVDTYISLAKRKADKLYPDPKDIEEKKRYLLPINGSFAQGSKYKGINPIRTFLFYGELIAGDKSEFYEFEIKPSVYKQLQKIAAVEGSDEVVGTDGCFTDPLDGRPFKVIVDSVASRQANDPSLYYSVSILNETEKIRDVTGRTINALKQYPISEEKLDWFAENVEPLIGYRTKFKSSDLKIQIEGLKLFDQEHGFGILEEEEFKEIYNYLDSKFPETEQTDDSQRSSDSVQQNSPKKPSNQDEFDLMDKDELRKYIKDQKLGIVVLPKYSEEDLREMIREVENEVDSQESEETEATTAEDPIEVGETTTQSTSSIKDRLAALQAKMGS